MPNTGRPANKRWRCRRAPTRSRHAPRPVQHSPSSPQQRQRQLACSFPPTLAQFHCRPLRTPGLVSRHHQLAEIHLLADHRRRPQPSARQPLQPSGARQALLPAQADARDRNRDASESRQHLPAVAQVDPRLVDRRVDQVTCGLPAAGRAAARPSRSRAEPTTRTSPTSRPRRRTPSTAPTTSRRPSPSRTTTTTRYVRVLFTANTGWPAGQASQSWRSTDRRPATPRRPRRRPTWATPSGPPGIRADLERASAARP